MVQRGAQAEHSRGHNEVVTTDDGVVLASWRGKQTVQSVQAMGEQIRIHLNALKAQGRKALTLSDITGLKASDMDSQARVAAKNLTAITSDASAVVGSSRLAALAMYIMRSRKTHTPSRYFTNGRKALVWLLGATTPKATQSSLALFAGIAVGLIGAGTLLGWQLHNAYLMSWLPSLRPMNPASAVALMAIGLGMIMFWANKFNYMRIIGVFGVALGVAGLLPVGIDHILYAGAVQSRGVHADMSNSAAACFLLIGIFAVITRRPWPWVRPVQYVLAAVTVLIALLNIFGLLYGHDYIYQLSPNFVMAFNLGVALLLAGSALFLLVLKRQVGDIFGFVSRTGWLVAAVLLFVQFATYSAWSQAASRNTIEANQEFVSRVDDIQASLNDRLQTYIDALRGFHGLFAASNQVSQADFDAYYKSLDLKQHYPGIRGMSYITAVKDADLPAFVQERRHDTSLLPGGNPQFTIQSKANVPVHYIATYSGETPTASTLGLDLASIPGRAEIYQAAFASGQNYASGTITFIKTSTSPAQPGFFIALPVKTVGATDYTGLVLASFNYADFFPRLLSQHGLRDDVDIIIEDAETHTHIYESHKAGGSVVFSRAAIIPVVNHQWDMTVSAPATFSVPSSQLKLPGTIVIVGQTFSMLLAVLFLILGRGRRQALALADSITEDLHVERNTAVANARKNSAILASIGDAVFAIDMQERLTLINPAAQALSGYTEQEALGKPYKQILRFEFEKDGKINDRFVRDALNGKLGSMKSHTVLVSRDGRKIPVADSAAPINDARGTIHGVIVVFRDITHEYELDRAKTEFVSLASHQLRTPLSAVNWYAEMLLNGDAGKLKKEQEEQIKEIYEGNQRMVELVNSLLDVSRLDMGKLANQPVPTAMPELLDSVRKEQRTAIQAKQIRYTQQVAPKLPPVIGDPKLLRMIVQNLLSNAIKYTPEKGSVAVTMLSADGQLQLAVADTGYGIPASQQGKIFSKLFRADNVRAMDVEGTGLGLYIVKEVVSKLGGTIRFESTERKGTTFYVTLPFDTWNRPHIAKDTAPAVKP